MSTLFVLDSECLQTYRLDCFWSQSTLGHHLATKFAPLSDPFVSLEISQMLEHRHRLISFVTPAHFQFTWFETFVK